MAHQDTSNAESIARRLCTFADAVRDSGLPNGDFSADTAEADRLMMEIYVARIFDGDAIFEYYVTWCLISRTEDAPPENPNEGIAEVLLNLWLPEQTPGYGHLRVTASQRDAWEQGLRQIAALVWSCAAPPSD